MAIIGLTDQTAQLPIIGILRKGEEKKGNKPGRDLDHFRFTSEDPEAIKYFEEAYTKQPRQVRVFLPHKTTDENIDAWMEHWVAGGLMHRCDGKTTVLWRTDKHDYSTEPKSCPGQCKQVGRLSVIVPELGRLATVTVLTTSIHDIKNLHRQLRSYEALSTDLRGVPFVITRRPVRISTPSGPNGQRARREKWLLSIETQPQWTTLKIQSMEQEALPVVEEARLIPETVQGEYRVVSDLPPGIVAPEDELKPEATKREREVLPPMKLAEVIAKKVEANPHVDDSTGEVLPVKLHQFGPKTSQIISAKFQSLFKEIEGDASPEAKYHACLKWLFTVESANDLSAAQADALLDWMLNGDKPKKFKAEVSPVATQEAALIYAETLKADGQLDMFEGEPELDEVFGER